MKIVVNVNTSNNLNSEIPFRVRPFLNGRHKTVSPCQNYQYLNLQLESELRRITTRIGRVYLTLLVCWIREKLNFLLKFRFMKLTM